MPRRFKALSLALSLATIGIFASSCNSSSKIRVVDTISDAPVNLDIDFDSSTAFANVPFESVSPSSGYQVVEPGSQTIEAVKTGTTTAVVNSTSIDLSSSRSYTAVLLGLSQDKTGPYVPTVGLMTDNNSAPPSGYGEFRIVHASPSAPVGLDIYLVPGASISNISPNISTLVYGQGSSYQSLPSSSSATYTLIVAAAGNKTPLLSQSYVLGAGQIRTLVLVDVSGGGALSSIPIELFDLN